MVFIVYSVQLILGFAIGAFAYSIIKPSISPMKRGVIAGIVLIVFMLATTTLISSSGLVPEYDHFLKHGE